MVAREQAKTPERGLSSPQQRKMFDRFEKSPHATFLHDAADWKVRAPAFFFVFVPPL